MREKLIIAILILAAIVTPVSATTISKTLPEGDTLIVNQTWAWNQSPHTPLFMFLIVLAIALLFTILSFSLKLEQCSDAYGYLAVPFWLIATVMSLGIEVKTSTAVTTIVSGTATTIEMANFYIVYSLWYVTLALAIMFIVALANAIRLYMQHKEMRFEDQMERGELD